MSSSLKQRVLGLFNILLSLFLLYILVGRMNKYGRHELSVTVLSDDDFGGRDPFLDFPALSVCFRHFDLQRLLDDLGQFTLVRRPHWEADPPFAYERIASRPEMINISTFLHTYYPRLDRIFQSSAEMHLGGTFGCKVGDSLCEVTPDMVPQWGAEEDATLETEVPAGIWKSRFFADGATGQNVLCHTLVPNVTVDFSVSNGNAVTMRWLRSLTLEVPRWHIYVHDKDEQVLMSAYAMADLPFLTFKTPTPGDDWAHKGKAKIIPRFHKRPNTAAHPCVGAHVYSQNECKLRRHWSSRVARLKNEYGDRLKCLVPGILLEEGDPNEDELLSTCTERKADFPGDVLGYIDLVNTEGMEDGGEDNLVSPPIGSESELLLEEACAAESRDDNKWCICPPRCSSYSHDLVVDKLDNLENDMWISDVRLFFASKKVEVWREFESYTLVSLLSDVGGLMGLLLGLSIASWADIAWDSVAKAATLVGKHI